MAVPLGVVTATFLTPTVPAGVLAVMQVVFINTIGAATPSTFTLVTPFKLVPVITNVVPPDVVPEAGLTIEIIGGPATIGYSMM